jgi:polysaccharide biosynthesis/export protein
MKFSRYSAILLLFLTFSCQYKKFTYLQPSASNTADSTYHASLTNYKIQPADIIYFKVTSLDEKVNQTVNQSSSSGSASMLGGNGAGSMYLTQYSVDLNGDILLPMIGKVHAAGQTIDEVHKEIDKLVTSFLKDATTDVKLVSFKVSVLGEVRSPGIISIFNDKANIFEALAMVGDISYNGNRQNVAIVRTQNSKTSVIHFDISRRDILGSPLFYLQPNDIIYVEPLKTTVFRLRVADYATLLTLLTSTITAALLIKGIK